MYDLDKIWTNIIAVLLSMSGGLARLLYLKDKESLNRWVIGTELFITAFAGVVFLMFARILGLSDDWVGLICGLVAGWGGPRFLFRLLERVAKTIGIETEENETEGKEE